MVRRLLITASALSLLICVAAAVTWIRSYRAQDIVAWQRPIAGAPRAGWFLICDRGGLFLGHWRSPQEVLGISGFLGSRSYLSPDVDPADVPSLVLVTVDPGGHVPPDHGLWGFGYYARASPTMLVPLWFPFLLFGSAALASGCWVGVRWRRRQRLSAGLCPVCAYDLRASTARCPECGTPIPVKMNA